MRPALPSVTATAVVRICLLLALSIALGDGLRQWLQGDATGMAEADNGHRFMAGIYLGWVPLFFWAAATVRRQGALGYFLAVPVFLGGLGRLISFAQYGVPDPAWVFLASAGLEFALSFTIVGAHVTALRVRRVAAVGSAVADPHLGRGAGRPRTGLGVSRR